jgi:NarL family two-component system sensor histidine kinase LiaS
VITLLVGAAREMVTDHAQATQTLDEAVRLTGQAQQELTALIHELRPLALAGKGLSAALAELLTGWEQSTGIAVETHLPDGLQAPFPIEQALYRIAQEALNNIARHSGASLVDLQLLREPERLTLRIQDNGCGFNPPQVEGRGQGLSNMRQRAEDVGGSLRAFSDAAGVCVETTVPLELAQPAAEANLRQFLAHAD